MLWNRVINLRQWALESPDRQCINEMSYKEVYEAVCLMAAKLEPYCYGTDRVAVYGSNAVDMAILLMGLWVLGKEVVLLNSRLTEEEVYKQAELVSVPLIFTNLVKESGLRKGLAFFSIDTVQCTSASEEKIEYFHRAERWTVNPEAIAVIMNTSATSGQMKSVPLRWRQYEAHVKASAAVLGVTDEDCWLMVLPLFHVSGMSILLRSIYNGRGLWIMDKYDKAELLNLVKGGVVNMVSLVPTILQQLIDELGDEHRLRCILLGGEAIPDALIEKALAKKLPVYKTYGMTECCSQCATFSVLEHSDKRKAVGRALPGLSITIENKDESGVGDVIVSGPMVMDGYLGREATKGRLNSGDMGYVDDDGFLYLVNRRTDLIISGGENIYPKEIEDCIYGVEGVRECAVIGRADDKWGQIPVAYIAADSQRREAIEAALAKGLAAYKRPKVLIFCDALPKNGTGKIARKELR